jgi:alkylated DNA repair dioxygenase AlkB
MPWPSRRWPHSWLKPVNRSASLDSPEQSELFEREAVPAITGLAYTPDFLSKAEESELLTIIRGFALKEAQYRQWQAHRRVISFGGKYDFYANNLLPADPIPPSLHPLRARIAQWCGLDAAGFTHALIAEYRPGTKLGWHRDLPHFEVVVGVSLASQARMRLRPYAPAQSARRTSIAFELAPRSIYTLQGPARWDWQHAICATQALRYSLTFRSLSARGERERRAC